MLKPRMIQSKIHNNWVKRAPMFGDVKKQDGKVVDIREKESKWKENGKQSPLIFAPATNNIEDIFKVLQFISFV